MKKFIAICVLVAFSSGTALMAGDSCQGKSECKDKSKQECPAKKDGSCDKAKKEGCCDKAKKECPAGKEKKSKES